jgi:hypothetical protein
MIPRFFVLLPAWCCTHNCIGMMRGNATTSQTRGTRGAQCLLSWKEVAARRLNWQCQLHNDWGGSGKDNGGDNKDDNNAEMMTTKTAPTVAGSVEINAGTDMVAALCQGLTMQGKHIQHQCQHQHLAKTSIKTSKQ